MSLYALLPQFPIDNAKKVGSILAVVQNLQRPPPLLRQTPNRSPIVPDRPP